MAFLTYTTAAEVRATLGVSTTELSDSVLALPIYDTIADESVDSVHSELADLFEAKAALLTPTALESKFVAVVKLYVTYAMASHLLTALPLFSVKSLTDGKAEFDRQSDVFADVKDGVNTMLRSLRARVEQLMELVDGTVIPASSPVSVSLVASKLATDPITG